MKVMERRFRPSLEYLEDRLTPSTVGPIDSQAAKQAVVGHAATHTNAATHMAEVTVPASATISFSKWNGTQQGGDIQVSITGATGLKFTTPEISVINNAKPADVASAVYAALPIDTVVGGMHSGGFVASLSPDGSNIIIKGYYNAAGKFQNIDKPKVSSTGGASFIKGGSTAFPALTYTSAYIYNSGNSSNAQVSLASGSMAFNFAPNSIDGTSSLVDAATVELTIDGTVIDVNETAGETYHQVADDVYSALGRAGLTGVSEDGSGNVILTQNFSGQSPLTLGITLISTTQNQDSWISVGIGTYS